MTEIEVEGEDPASGLLALVITVVDILTEALEREAVRRMESGNLTDDEIERLGRQLAAIEEELESIMDEHDITDDVERLRGDLDGLLRDAMQQVATEEAVTPAREGDHQ